MAAMKAPATPTASPADATNRSGGGTPTGVAADHTTAVFKLGLDISPLRPRQRLIVRMLLQRMSGNTAAGTPLEPRS